MMKKCFFAELLTGSDELAASVEQLRIANRLQKKMVVQNVEESQVGEPAQGNIFIHHPFLHLRNKWPMKDHFEKVCLPLFSKFLFHRSSFFTGNEESKVADVVVAQPAAVEPQGIVPPVSNL